MLRAVNDSPALDAGSRHALLFLAAATTLPHFTEVPYWLSGLVTAILGWALWLIHQRAPRLHASWLFVAVVGACAGVLAEYRTLFGRDAGVALLVLFMSLKQLETRNERDAMVTFALACFLLITHFFYAQTLLVGAWLMGCTGLACTCLVRIHGGPQGLRPMLRKAGILTLQAAPFMVVLYLLFPRINGPLWGLPQDAFAARSGLSDVVSPGSIAELALSGEIAFRVRFFGEAPAKHQLYWRGPVLENFDGQKWTRDRDNLSAPAIIPRSTPIRYESTLEASNQHWLLALDAPGQSEAIFRLDGRLTALSKEPIRQRQRVTLTATADYHFNIAENPKTLERNRFLPPRRNPQARALAASWQQTLANPAAIVEASLRHFANNEFVYTLRPPMLGTDSVDEFLFTTRRGFCEHYAAAFVFLMRAAGIPARIVTGYQGGERNPIDGFYVVRQSDAHAWAEVWLDKEGWKRVDPTAAISPNRVEAGIVEALPAGEPLPILMTVRADWLKTLRHRWEALNNAWNQHVLGYDSVRQRDLLARLGFPEADWQQLVTLLASGCGLALALIVFTSLRQRPNDDPAHQLWHRALHKLKRSGVDCEPYEGPLALAARVQRMRPDLSESFAELAQTYLAVRYHGQHHQLDTLRQSVARFKP